MVKLIDVEPKGGYHLALRFSDGASGVFDFTLRIPVKPGHDSGSCRATVPEHAGRG